VLKKAVSKGRLTVVDMGDNAKVSDALSVWHDIRLHILQAVQT
jgi:hypothetical protein